MNKQWQLGLLIAVGLLLVGLLTYATMQAINEVERTVAIGLNNMYAQE